MRISFSGAQCTGKTTLMEALRKELPNYTVQDESVRYLVKNYDFDIKSANTDLQLALLHWQTKALYENENILLDRSFIDSTAYMLYYNRRGTPKVPTNVYRYIMDMVRDLSKKIDLFVFMKPEFDLVDDGFRVLDKEQQMEITETMEYLFQYFGLKDKLLIVSGSVENRVKQVLSGRIL